MYQIEKAQKYLKVMNLKWKIVKMKNKKYSFADGQKNQATHSDLFSVEMILNDISFIKIIEIIFGRVCFFFRV